jgi:hypothetical protein
MKVYDSIVLLQSGLPPIAPFAHHSSLQLAEAARLMASGQFERIRATALLTVATLRFAFLTQLHCFEFFDQFLIFHFVQITQIDP